jgi:plastocyanin
MRRFVIAALGAATALSVFACGSGYNGSSPTGPTPSSSASAPPADAIVINVVAINGAQSFAPNPATVPAGRLVVWHNVDSVTHRVVFNDGEVDSGDIAPGAYSAAMGLAAPGPYHCSIHPAMVGTVVGQ